MLRGLGRLAVPLVGRRARLRWLHQILGGALLMPYFLVALVICQVVELPAFTRSPVILQFGAYFLALPMVAATAFVPLVRPLEMAVTRALLGIDVAPGPAASWSARWRGAVWYLLHLAVGALVAGATLAVPPAAGLFIVLPLIGHRPRMVANGSILDLTGIAGWAPLIGVGMLVGLVAVAGLVGIGMARLAAVLLRPSPAERLTDLERRAAQLVERNRLARELHDSVGHALSVVTIQAGAAGRVLDRDPAFARQALSAIEKTARDALADLDHVLGLLREEPSGTRDQPTLADLDRLLSRGRGTGIAVDARVDEVSGVPAVVSREAYRIVQEGLTNALRHAGRVPVSLRLRVSGRRLELEMTNPIGTAEPAAGRSGGGRGLTGVTERVAALRGRVFAGPDDGVWRLAVELPL